MNSAKLSEKFKAVTAFAKEVAQDGPSYLYTAMNTAFFGLCAHAAVKYGAADPVNAALVVGGVAVATKLLMGVLETIENRTNASRGWDTGWAKFTNGY